MRTLLFALAAVATLGTACTNSTVDPSSNGGGGAGGTSDEGGSSPDSCDAPDTSCPLSLPFPGSPCRNGLECSYEDDVVPWEYTCENRRWRGVPDVRVSTTTAS